MKKRLDFTKFPLPDVEGNFTECDLSKEIANIVFRGTMDVQAAELSMRIVRERNLCLTDEEIGLLRDELGKPENMVLASVKIGFERLQKNGETVE